MEDTKFTLGPWELCYHLKSIEHDKSCHCGYRGGIGNGDYMICEMGSTQIQGEEGLELPRFDRETEIANAHLIAAAPELYGMLSAVLEGFENYNMECLYKVDKEEIESLLAKARGEL